ncbi:hypothetical protein [Nonomuraea sp. CA-218870]|uniref:hypothetical protein n=1 Tax=Nonomuraea sp. CA-218870 TaxID=3239998 RepID=UPI003D8CD9D1
MLEAIDACLNDSLSPDAMRWAPDEPDPTPEDRMPDDVALAHLLSRGWPILDPRPVHVVPADGESYWSPITGETAVWPEGACPRCGRCMPESLYQSLHEGEPIGPARVTYMCGYEERVWRNRR